MPTGTLLKDVLMTSNSGFGGSIPATENGAADDAIVVLIPAYKPEGELTRLVEELSASSAIAAVILVDDGSGSDYAGVFLSLARNKKVRLLAHVVNLGKGAALK